MFVRWAAALAAVVALPMAAVGETAAPLREGYDLFDSGKLLATGGVSQVEGSGGGGLTPWALITGYGTRDSIGGNAHYTYIHTGDYALHTAGVAVGLFDRLELSYARQWFDTRKVGGALGLGNGYTIAQDIYGAKLRLLGDAVNAQDSLLPQVSVGLQYKVNDRGALLSAIGADDDEGIDYYVSATKIFLAESLLLSATLRYTRANQFGILGFGGDLDDDYEFAFEGSAAYLINRNWVIGAEYRMKPDNLGIAQEDDAFDAFIAWLPSKNISLTLAYVDLGNIVIADDQRGVYVSLQAGF
jgi:hypothetical protein